MATRSSKPRNRLTSRELSTAWNLQRPESTAKAGYDLLTWLLFFLFIVAALAIIQWRGAPHPVLVDQRSERPFVARVPFAYKDLRKTEDLRQEARSKAPHVYVERLDILSSLRRQVRDLFDRSSEDIGLRKWNREGQGESGHTKDVELRKYLLTMGLETYEKCLDRLFETLRQRGVVSRERYEEERRSNNILAIRSGSQEEEHLASEQLLAPGYGGELRSCIEDTFSRSPDPCQNLLKELFMAELVPTLEYDPQRTRAGKERAAQGVQTVVREYKENDELLAAGEITSPDHIALLRAESFHYNLSQPPQTRFLRLGGVAILVLFMSTLAAKYLRQSHPKVLRSHLEAVKLTGLCVLALATAKIILTFGDHLPLSPYLIPTYLIPLPFFSAVITVVYSQRMARVFSFLLAILIGIMAGNNFPLLVVLVMAALVAIALSWRIRDRSKPLYIGLAAGGAQALASVTIALMTSEQPWLLWPEPLTGLVNGLIIGVALTVLLPMVERIFNVVTDLTLLELSDQNHPLLRRLALEAPGTYQHTLMMAMLAEAGAEAIEANSLLARVGCYYHDIGKTNKPHYFVENEDWSGSQHKKLNPSMSTLIITSHTRDGVALARGHKLPKAIVDFIPEHHGTTLIEYFYRQALNQENGPGVVDEALYRYPGPKPQSRETGIALLADASEAACRTLSNPTPSRIRNLVHEILMNKLLDGQLDECQLTLHDLAKIEDSFVRSLNSFHHARVKYPGS